MFKSTPKHIENHLKTTPESVPKSIEVSMVAPAEAPLLAQPAFGHYKLAPKVLLMTENSTENDTKVVAKVELLQIGDLARRSARSAYNGTTTAPKY